MAAKLHYNMRDLGVPTATSQAAGYSVLNLAESPVDKPWRSTTNALQNIDIDLGSAVAVTAVGVQMTNAPSFTVLADTFTPPTTNRGTLTPYADNAGRRKGGLAFTATVRYIRLQIPATSVVADDDDTVQTYYTVGALYVFGSTLMLPRDPSYAASVKVNTPQQRVDLPNGQALAVVTGPNVSEISLPFSVRSSHDIERAGRLARLGPCWLDLDIASERWRQWPVRSVEDNFTRRIARVNAEAVELAFREMA